MYRVGRARLYIAIAVTIILESTFMILFSFNGMRPNLILVLIIFVGLNSDWQEALEAGIVGGLLRGTMTSGSIGINLTILALCGIFASYCKNKVYKESFLAQMALTLVVAILVNTLSLFCKIAIGNVDLMGLGIKRTFAPTVISFSIYTALVAPPAFFCLKRMLSVREQRF